MDRKDAINSIFKILGSEIFTGWFIGVRPVQGMRVRYFSVPTASECKQFKQECIPVGCVPAAHRPYARVCFPGGGGVCSRGVSAPGEGVLSGLEGGLLQGGSARGVVSGLTGVCPRVGLLWGGGIPACTEADPPCEQNE